MKCFKYLIVFLLFLSLNNCFCQNKSMSDDQLFKVVKIDSTENFFLIFLSKSIDTSYLNNGMPSLIKASNCNGYYSIDDKHLNYYVILSYKSNCIKRNIITGDVLNFSQNCSSQINNTLSSVSSFTHLGYGEYLEDNQNLNYIYPKEVFSLYYSKNCDTITYLNHLKEQVSYFDSSMLKIWMSFSKSKTCYKAWLNEIISESQQVEIDNIDNYLVLFEDIDCLILSKTINFKDFTHNQTLMVTMYYKAKHCAFVKIGDSLNTFYGWIKIKQTKQSKHYSVYQ